MKFRYISQKVPLEGSGAPKAQFDKIQKIAKNYPAYVLAIGNPIHFARPIIGGCQI